MKLLKYLHSMDFYCSSDDLCNKSWPACSACDHLCVFYCCSDELKDFSHIPVSAFYSEDKNFFEGSHKK